jgi:hypothetical protein
MSNSICWHCTCNNHVIFSEILREVYMLYIGLAVGLVLGSFMTVISLALFKEVSTEQDSGTSRFQVVKHGSERI